MEYYESDSEEENISDVNAFASCGNSNQVYVEIHISDRRPVRRATVTILLRKFIGSCNILPNATILQMWNGSHVKSLGEAKIEIFSPASQNRYRCKFIIVSDQDGLVPTLRASPPKA